MQPSAFIAIEDHFEKSYDLETKKYWCVNELLIRLFGISGREDLLEPLEGKGGHDKVKGASLPLTLVEI